MQEKTLPLIRHRRRERSRIRPVAVVTTTVPVTLQAFFGEYLEQLLKNYHVVVVSAPGPEMVTIRERHPELECVPLPMMREISLRSDGVAIVKWLAVLCQYQPELVLSMTPKASLMSMLASAIVGVRHRVYLAGGLRLEGESRTIQRWLLWSMERLTCAAATDVVANSASLARAFADAKLAGEPKLRSTKPGSSHGVDCERFVPPLDRRGAKSALQLDPNLPVVGLVGRLTRDKGIDCFLEAVSRLVEMGVSAQFVIVGAHDEPDSERYLRRIKTEFAGSVVLVDHMSQVENAYASFDVHALPSWREGFPNAVLEASAMGIPSVVSDATGAVDSVMHGETGLIVPRGDADALAEAIHCLVTRKAERDRLGGQARRWVACQFQPREIVGDVLMPYMRHPHAAEARR